MNPNYVHKAMYEGMKERAEKAEKALVLIGDKALVDFDDATVGQVDSVVKNREKYVDWLRKVELSVVRQAEAVALLRECASILREVGGGVVWTRGTKAVIASIDAHLDARDGKERVV